MRNEETMCEGLLSVVIPVYNIRDYVERCVRSVLAQPDVPLEVLIVDDGSTDDSGAVCDALAAEDSRVTVIHKPNGGLSDAAITGCAMHRASISCSWTVMTGWQRTFAPACCRWRCRTGPMWSSARCIFCARNR